MNELVPSVSIENLLNQRDAIVERLRKAAELLTEVETLTATAFHQAPYNHAAPTLEDRKLHRSFPSSLDVFEKAVDATAWSHLLSISGIRTFMDAKARSEWSKAIDEMKVPELTEDNIRSTFRNLYDSRSLMFENGVIEIYRSLSWCYKTNCPRQFGKRIIINYCIDTYGTGSKRHTAGASYKACDKLDDLIRVFHLLDGKPEPDHRQGAYRKLRDVQWPEKTKVVTFDYISIKGFMNGNGHVTFLRPDLVDKMNLILAKHYSRTLPPAEEG